MAHGLCDNVLLAVYLSATCPVVVAPAMDEDMWHHPATQSNLDTISSFGNDVIPVEKGELASGLEGEGRMAEPESIVRFLLDNFFLPRTFRGKRAHPELDLPASPLTLSVSLETDLQERWAWR